MKTSLFKFFFCVTCLFSNSVYAQVRPALDSISLKKADSSYDNGKTLLDTDNHKISNKVIFELYGLLSLPQGEFKYVSNNMWGLGFGGALLYNPLSKLLNPKFIRPYILGLQLDDTRFSSDAINTENFMYNGRSFRQEYEFKTKGLSLGYLAKVELFDYKIYPFLLVQAGFRFYKGKQEITYEAYHSDEQQYAPQDISNSLPSSSTNYMGFGGGIGYGNGTFRAELRCINQRGSMASYIDTESIKIFPNNTYTFEYKKSTTDVFLTQLAVSLRF
ncbi:MAG: hypothetical protein MH472_04210 [Bacteroidia bacterium]|nr:hypothetical protein [Bacteroidia bacterium]